MINLDSVSSVDMIDEANVRVQVTFDLLQFLELDNKYDLIDVFIDRLVELDTIYQAEGKQVIRKPKKKSS